MDYLDMRVFSTVNTDQSFINWAKTSRTVSTRNQCRKLIQRTWPQCSDWVGFRENTTKTTVPFIITFKMKQHGWKNTRIDLMTFPSAALPSGKEHLIEFKRMKPPQYLNEWHPEWMLHTQEDFSTESAFSLPGHAPRHDLNERQTHLPDASSPLSSRVACWDAKFIIV